MMQNSIDAGKSENKIFTIPNLLSFLRICLIPVIIWLYLVKDNSIWAGFALIFSGVTDVLDGYIARRFQMISDFGKVLDPVADKLTQAAILICLSIRFPLMIIHIFFPKITSTISVILIAACTLMIGITFVLYVVRNTKALRQ